MATRDKRRAKIFVTGGAGFMGRWVSKNLIDKGHRVFILDNLSNSSERNIGEFKNGLMGFNAGDIRDKGLLKKVFNNNFDICIHLAATINVQASIDNPADCFDNNITGTFNVLEECKRHNTKMVFISSALIYETAKDAQAISENHPLNPSCPYTASKIAAENLVMAYYKTYGLPAVILRPFSIYGPWQRPGSEGGVMSIFIEKRLKGLPVEIFGNIGQGRDFFYIEDCAEFIAKAAFSDKAVGEIFNAGSGKEVKIKDLAKIMAEDKVAVKVVRHPHPHAEIISMRADIKKSRAMLGWKPAVGLQEGIKRTEEWLRKRY